MYRCVPSICLVWQKRASSVYYVADAKFTLSKAEFVPLCSSGLQLTVVLDADHQVAETNELNNKYVLDDIVIIDGDDANFCTSKFLELLSHSNRFCWQLYHSSV